MKSSNETEVDGADSGRRWGARRAARTMVGPACLLLFLLLCNASLFAAPIPVRFSEGMTRGFLVLNDSSGKRLGSGDFLQVTEGAHIKARTVIHFKDGSLHDETAVFSQHGHFVLQSYHLVQKGLSFKDEMDITLDRVTQKYVVKTRPRKDGQEKVLQGKLELPPDVYNGMVPTAVKNLKSSRETVHMVAFTPTPRVIEMEVIPSGEDTVMIGDLKRKAEHYVLKPKLGLLLKIPAALLGRTPPDNQMWIITSEVPAFVRFEGPLATDGPIWRVELTSPVWPK